MVRVDLNGIFSNAEALNQKRPTTDIDLWLYDDVYDYDIINTANTWTCFIIKI